MGNTPRNDEYPISSEFTNRKKSARNLSLKCDRWIIEQAKQGMITPFVEDLVREADGVKRLSYGTSSYGYDLRLSPVDFRLFKHIPGSVLDPKNFNPDNLESVRPITDDTGCYFILPAHSYGLGVALERLVMPDNVIAVMFGKSSYARCGIILNVTPAEPRWQGHLTLEFSNSSDTDCKIYAEEGIGQMLFLEGDRCANTYGDRKYQNQAEQVTLPK